LIIHNHDLASLRYPSFTIIYSAAALASCSPSCYAETMHREPNQWRASRATRALKRLNAIEKSITALQDNDLLDFADIFVGTPDSPLGELAAAEMANRKISL
jgi:hypothetical protein